MQKGSTVECLIDYDLFGVNILGKEGCYISFNEFTQKALIWFPCNGEFAELKSDQFKTKGRRGHIKRKYKIFVSSIKKLGS